MKTQRTLQERHSDLIKAHIQSMKHNVLLQDIIDDLDRQLNECRKVIREQVENVEM